MKTLKAGKEVTEYLNQSEDHRVKDEIGYVYYQDGVGYLCIDPDDGKVSAGLLYIKRLVELGRTFEVIESPPTIHCVLWF